MDVLDDETRGLLQLAGYAERSGRSLTEDGRKLASVTYPAVMVGDPTRAPTDNDPCSNAVPAGSLPDGARPVDHGSDG